MERVTMMQKHLKEEEAHSSRLADLVADQDAEIEELAEWAERLERDNKSLRKQYLSNSDMRRKVNEAEERAKTQISNANRQLAESKESAARKDEQIADLKKKVSVLRTWLILAVGCAGMITLAAMRIAGFWA